MGRQILGKAKKKTLSVSGRKCRESYYKKNRTRPEGIEPPSQEPESYVISTTLRTQALG